MMLCATGEEEGEDEEDVDEGEGEAAHGIPLGEETVVTGLKGGNED